jgi:hypothetical protein
MAIDPAFVAKVQDDIELLLSPPDSAMVPCVDENGRIQVLERTRSALPLGLGYAGPRETRGGSLHRLAIRQRKSHAPTE